VGKIQKKKAAAETGDRRQETGDAKAQYVFGFMKHIDVIAGGYGGTWIRRAAADQGYPDAMLARGLFFVIGELFQGDCPQRQEERFHSKAKGWVTKSAVEHNSAEAQYIIDMLDCFQQDCWQDGCARSKPDMLETARWFRMAAHQGLAEAQWELGEWFRRGLFCDVHVPFARQYIRRAARQGHAEAIARLEELCSCVYCATAAAPLKCSTCLATMYCDAACSKKHWRKGGGVSEVCEAALPHKKTCPRTFDDPCA
jgi:hypothetical protein